MQRALVWLALLAVASARLGAAASDEPHSQPSRRSLDSLTSATFLERSSLVEAVLARNPSLAAARQARAAALEEVPQAASLDDPTASYSLAPLSIGSSTARFGEMLRVGQRLPFPGTLRLRADAAGASASAAGVRVEEVRQRLAATASVLFDDYWLVERGLAITEEHLRLLETFQRVATSRYAAGLAPQQAPIQAELEAARLLHRQVVLRSERRRLSARLNALLHRPADAPLPAAPERLAVEDDSMPEPGEIGEEGAIEAAAPLRPELAAQRAEVEALRARVALARLAGKPDFEVTTGYNSMWGTEEHRLTVGVGVRLPLWRERIRAGVAEAEARLAAGESTLAALTDRLAAEVESALASLEEAEHAVRLYRSRVLPPARDQVTAARAAFESGEVSMLDLIDAERSLLAAELGHAEAVADLARARAELDLALGRMPFGLAVGPPRRSDPARAVAEPDHRREQP